MENSLTLPNWLKQRAFLTPDRTAVKMNGTEATFAHLYSEAQKMAGKLSGIGIKKGSMAGVMMKNSLDMVIIIHAIHLMGATAVMLNTRLTAKELQWQITDSHLKVLIMDDSFQPLVKEFPKEINVAVSSSLERLPFEDYEEQAEFDLDKPATIMYTSGTTGNPKGVIQTFGNHWWSASGSALNLGIHANDVWLAMVPFFHISGLSILMRSVIYGMPVVVHESFDPNSANRAIMEEGVTIVSVVSAMLHRMLEDLGSQNYPDSFRCMLLGGGPAPKPMLEDCRDRGIPVFQTYGMTETSSQIVTLAPEDSLRKLGSAGKPLFPAQARIMNNGILANPGESGEIVVKGPNVTRGYLNRPDETKRAITDGWLHTGDIGYMDEEGFLYVLDRRSDLIISGGENIYPAEIESVLMSHPSVNEAGVTGYPDEKWGKVPFAFITGDSLPSEEELKDFCQARLAKYKVPKRIFTVSELPRNASQKLLRRELIKLVPSEEGGSRHEN